jgi:hypothetical protein
MSQQEYFYNVGVYCGGSDATEIYDSNSGSFVTITVPFIPVGCKHFKGLFYYSNSGYSNSWSICIRKYGESHTGDEFTEG